jgi:hypothetical protein
MSADLEALRQIAKAMQKPKPQKPRKRPTPKPQPKVIEEDEEEEYESSILQTKPKVEEEPNILQTKFKIEVPKDEPEEEEVEKDEDREWLKLKGYPGSQIPKDQPWRIRKKGTPRGVFGVRDCAIRMNEGNGYKYVSMPNPMSLHTIVARQFIPNPDNLRHCDHISGDKFDNSIENLRWVTSVTSTANQSSRHHSRTLARKRKRPN